MPATSSSTCSSPTPARSTAWRKCGARNSTKPPPARTPLPDLRLIAIGRIGTGPEAALFDRYNARLRPPFRVTELPEGRGSPGEIKRREGDAILAALPAQALAIALDLGAPAPSSETFATLLTRWLDTPRPLCFLIGGAEGLDPRILGRADHTLSLGPMTWPHLLVRPMLAEQTFRARAIAAGHPYHRAGRP